MKKKTLATLLLCFTLFFGSCSSPKTNSSIHDNGTDSENENLAPIRSLKNMSAYDLETYLLPYWNTREVYQETVMVMESETEIPLLFTPDDVFCVKNYALNTVYEEGKDYTFKGGKLSVVANGKIPVMPIDEYYIDHVDVAKNTGKEKPIPVDKTKVPFTLVGDKWLNFGDGDELTSKQISVCYRHSQKWDGPVPSSEKTRLAFFFEKLEQKQDVSVVFYGDSITTGASSSSFEQFPPRAQIWPKMITEYIASRYGVKVNYRNEAVGGYSTAQGEENFETVLSENADLLVLAFGMNDTNTKTNVYKGQIQRMVEKFREKNPNGEVVLVSPMTPNYESTLYGNQHLFSEPLKEVRDAHEYCALADVTPVFEYLFTAGKRFRDLTVNNLNHPNDFGARLYAQVILQTVLGEDFNV